MHILSLLYKQHSSFAFSAREPHLQNTQKVSVLQLSPCICTPAGEDLVSIDSFVQHNATACAYLASLSDSLCTPTAPAQPSLAHQASSTSLLTLDQLLNGSTDKGKVPAVYRTCLSECILGTTDFDAVLIGLSDLYEQVGR